MRRSIRTGAVGLAEGKNLRLDSSTACLEGAVVETVAETRVRAIAGDIAIGASELRIGDLDHVADTHLLR